MRHLPLLLLMVSLLASPRTNAVERLGADAFEALGELTLGAKLAADGLSLVDESRDGTSTWNRSQPIEFTSGLTLSRVRLVTYKGLLLGVSGVASLAEADAWAAGLASREGERVRITLEKEWAPAEDESPTDSGYKMRVSFESLVVREVMVKDLLVAERAVSAAWKGTFTGVDARLDPRVAAALDSASAKYGWAATLKFSGALTLAGSGVGLYMTEGESKPLFGTAALGLAFIVVGAVLGSSASSDIASVTAPR